MGRYSADSRSYLDTLFHFISGSARIVKCYFRCVASGRAPLGGAKHCPSDRKSVGWFPLHASDLAFAAMPANSVRSKQPFLRFTINSIEQARPQARAIFGFGLALVKFGEIRGTNAGIVNRFRLRAGCQSGGT